MEFNKCVTCQKQPAGTLVNGMCADCRKAQNNGVKYIDVPDWLIDQGELEKYTIIVVQNNSLEDFGILSGDKLIIKRCQPNQGDIVLARFRGTHSIGKLYYTAGIPWLLKGQKELRQNITGWHIVAKATAVIREIN